jgi:hypothetical protein
MRASRKVVGLVSLRCASATLAFVLSMIGQASAAEQFIALDYSAPSSCPSVAEFEAQIRSFVPGASVVPRTASARVFEISIEESGTFGRLRLATEQGVGSRVAQGIDCAEVSRLLAFAVALVLDPQLQMAEPSSPVTSRIADAEPLDPGILPHPLPAWVAPTAPLSEGRSPGLAEQRARSARQSLSAVGSMASAMSPNPSYGVGALYGRVAALGSLEPQIRVGASYLTSEPVSRDGATVKFVGVLGAVEACPMPFNAGGVALWPCMRVDGGARNTSGSGIPGAKSRVRPWLSLDAVLYARFRLASPLFVELGGGAMVPVLRDRVFLLPDITVHRVPSVGFLGQIAVGVEFGDRNRN